MKPTSEAHPAQLADFVKAAQSLPGKIAGLRSLKAGTPQVSTAPRTQGFKMAVVAVLENPEDLESYDNHPVHVAYAFPVFSFIGEKLAPMWIHNGMIVWLGDI